MVRERISAREREHLERVYKLVLFARRQFCLISCVMDLAIVPIAHLAIVPVRYGFENLICRPAAQEILTEIEHVL